MPDLAAAIGDLVMGWGADHVTVAVRLPGRQPLVVGPPGRAYALASVTKLFTAVVTLVAVEEGALALTDAAGPKGSTVEHLLAHTSGLGFDGSEPLTTPGRRRIYSNAGYEVLAESITAATGIDFATYASEAVLQPLGMAGTVITGSPAAGWQAPATDVLALLDQIRRPTILAAETVARATSVAFPGLAGVLPGVGRFDPLDWGLGFEVRDGKAPHWTGKANSPRTVGHFGGRGTFAWDDPDAEVTCVALSDREFGEWALQEWPVLSDLVLTNGDRRPT
ncbi:MAG TPA: serine hydrolase domain-containing protein [Acidimicrobiales bacterium]